MERGETKEGPTTEEGGRRGKKNPGELPMLLKRLDRIPSTRPVAQIQGEIKRVYNRRFEVARGYAKGKLANTKKKANTTIVSATRRQRERKKNGGVIIKEMRASALKRVGGRRAHGRAQALSNKDKRTPFQ